jgi:PadR family transcriptional regulator, regulatory protein PadR
VADTAAAAPVNTPTRILPPRLECNPPSPASARFLDDQAVRAKHGLAATLEWAGAISTAPEQDPSHAERQAEAARAGAAEAARAADAAGTQRRGRPSDVFGGELRRRDMFTLLVFHLIARSDTGASYGNQLIEQIEEMTAGRVSLNPNTMYPLLRGLESDGFIEGQWEHPQKRSRRMYTLTDSGRGEYARLKEALEPFLDQIVRSITLIKVEIYGEAAKPPDIP